MQDVKLFTFHNAENYGAMLQAYALKETLKNLGTSPKFVNYQNKYILDDYKLIKTNSLKSFFSSLWYFPRNLRRKKAFKSFSDKYLDTKDKKYLNKKEIENDIKETDILISGSDQILNTNLTHGLDDVYALNFACKNEKIIYGASVGNEELLFKNSNEFREKLEEVDFLSVREKEIVKPLEDILKKEVKQVLDPTLLIRDADWESIIKSSKVKLENKEYILVYTLFESEDVTKIANTLSKNTGLKIVHFRKYNAYENEFVSLYKSGPETFVNAFKNARYIITNSFHGTAFSVIFKKNFYSVLPYERGGRIKDLLSLLNLNYRIIKDYSEINLEQEIDYINLEKIIDEQRQKSIEFLKKGIECQKNHNY